MKTYILTLLILLAPLASADVVLSNSASWQNVYSAGLYAALTGNEYQFLTSAKHAELVLNEIPDGQKIIVIESDQKPYSKSYGKWLRQRGYPIETILIPEKTGNIDLAKRVNSTKFIIVDPTFGYDAISALPYAVSTNSYVLFANRKNIDSVANFLAKRNVEKLTLFGDLDPNAKETLASYNPTILQAGNKYKNNIVMAKLHKQSSGATQAVLTSGEFLEPDLFRFENDQTIIIIGQDQTPQEILRYIDTAGFETLILLGNELVNQGEQIKEQTNIPTFIKFGKGVTGSGGYKRLSGLDTMPVPKIDILLSLKGIYYNLKTGKIELVLKNEKSIRTYLRNSIVIKDKEDVISTLGDENINRLEDKATFAYTYPATITEDSNLSAEIFVPYGASEDTLDKAITQTLPIKIIDTDNNCEVKLVDTEYNQKTARFEITIYSKQKCFAQARIENLIVDDEETTIQGSTTKISGKTKLELKQKLTEIDIADNTELALVIQYGSREEVLAQTLRETVPFKLKSATDPLLIAVILLVILVIILAWKRKKK